MVQAGDIDINMVKRFEESKTLKRIYWLALLLVMILIVWVRIDLTTYSTTLTNRVSALEEATFPKLEYKTEPYTGNPKSKVGIVLFCDMLDEDCFNFYNKTYIQMKKDYIDKNKVLLIYKDTMPNLSIIPFITECTRKQNKFWVYYEAVMEKGWPVTTDKIDVVLRGKTDYSKLLSCLVSDETKDAVLKDMDDIGRLRVTQAPTLSINGKMISGEHSYSYIKKIIEEELKK